MKHLIVEIATIYSGYPHSMDSEIISRKITNVYTFSSKKSAYTYMQGVCHSAININHYSVNSAVKYVNGVSDYYTEIIIDRNIANMNDYMQVEYHTFTKDGFESWLESLLDDICKDEHEADLFSGLNHMYTTRLENNIMDIYCGYSPSYCDTYDKDLHAMYYLAL